MLNLLRFTSFLAIFCFAFFSTANTLFTSTANTLSEPSVTTGLDEQNTITSLEKRLAEMEDKIVKLQRDNKDLVALFTRMDANMKTEFASLQVKENLTGTLITSHIAARKQADEAILQNMTFISQQVLRLENEEKVMTNNISNLANLTSNLEKEALDIERKLLNHSSEITQMNEKLSHIAYICVDPPTIANGHPLIEGGRHSHSKHGTVITYACEAGSTLVGSGDMVCYFGQWTGVLPRCANNCNTQDLKKEYDALDIPTNTSVDHSKTVDVRCRRGYLISSSSASPTCNDGTWHVTADPCIRDWNSSCDDDPPSLRNGKITDFDKRHDSRVIYECDRNFVMTGNSSVRCESGQWEGDTPACSYFDASFYAELFHYPSQYFVCHSDSYGGKIRFSRVIDTGTGGGLPSYARISSSEKSVKMDPNVVEYLRDSVGVYRCGYEAEEGSTYAVVPDQGESLLFFLDPYPVASLGDNVTLRLYSLYTTSRVLWSRNGSRTPALDGRKELQIINANSEDEGVYSAHYQHQSFDWALMYLSVRKCKANVFGELCDQVCPSCYNGGICHDMLGICVCPQGFVGRSCETPCPEGFYGADCSTACGREMCYGRLFCNVYPYGCTCAPGFKGYWCHVECDPGWYGGHCKQPCHCAEGGICNRFTGTCSGGCAPGWKGLTCQIRDDE